jgi:hypothetical protein
VAAAARDLAWVGRHEPRSRSARRRSRPGVAPAERIDWLDARADSLTRRAELDAAAADARPCSKCARRRRRRAAGDGAARAGPRADAPRRIGAGRSPRARRPRRRAAGRAIRRWWPAACSASAKSRFAPASARPRWRRRAGRRGVRALGDAVHVGRAHWLIAFVLGRLSQAQGSRAAAERAAALARQTGDEQGLGNALNILTFSSRDIAERMSLLQQATQAFERSGHLERRAAVLGNVALVLGDLGLYRHALRVGTEALDLSRRISDRVGVMMGLGLTLNMEVRSGHLERARARWPEYEALVDESEVPGIRVLFDLNRGVFARSEGDPQRAARILEGAAQHAVRTNGNLEFACLVALAEAELAAGRIGPALQASERAAAKHRAQDLPAPGHRPRPRHLVGPCTRAERARSGRRSVARAPAGPCAAARCGPPPARRRAAAQLPEQGAGQPRGPARVAARGRAPQGAGGAAAGPSAHPQRPREPFKRLVDTGTRLNELRSEAALHGFLIDEITELSGAERVLLVLVAADGWRVAGVQLPASEDAATLLQAITPWLHDAGRNRAVSLRHGPAACRRSTSAPAWSRRWSRRTRCSASSMPTSKGRSAASARPTATCCRCWPRRLRWRSRTPSGRRISKARSRSGRAS